MDILEGRAEVDRVLFNDPDPEIGFQLAYCMKWPGTKETLYCNTFVMDSSILSIRSLRAKHLPLLKYMKNKSIQVIQDKYGLGEENLRIYVHYQPSFYWFHLHIVNVNYFPLSMDVERAILLEDIIQNLEMSDTYYQNKTLLFHVDENSELNSKIQDYLDDKNL